MTANKHLLHKWCQIDLSQFIKTSSCQLGGPTALVTFWYDSNQRIKSYSLFCPSTFSCINRTIFEHKMALQICYDLRRMVYLQWAAAQYIYSSWFRIWYTVYQRLIHWTKDCLYLFWFGYTSKEIWFLKLFCILIQWPYRSQKLERIEFSIVLNGGITLRIAL